ncbi:MAG: hypothetical protein EAZ92_04065 [Candidatus Kapaibacterium sp.]|nr:MAG: hypothetical protein EAZ92_04065 [Candidatus Kapabacteria bacterium]
MRSPKFFFLCVASVLLLGAMQTLPAQQAISRYTANDNGTSQAKRLATPSAMVRGIDVLPFIVASEDSLQSYIQDNAISVWVNVPSLQRSGDTLTAVVKRVLRYDITHRLNKDLVNVDVMKFNTRNDTFARVASLDAGTNTLAPNTKAEWEKTSQDEDVLALYHYVGYLYEKYGKK